MDINIPEVVADLTATFRRYDPALLAQDLKTLNELFWNSPRVVRFGISENVYGHDAIADYRQQSARTGRVPERKIVREVITTYGRDLGTTNVEYVQTASGRRGRQSQVWMRTAEGWRIVSAHVSLMQEPALN